MKTCEKMMVMIRPAGKAAKVAKNVLKNKGVDVKAGVKMQKGPLKPPYLQH